MPSPVFDQPGLEVDADQLAVELERGSVVLVDVREPYEWDAGRIPCAQHLPLSELSARAGELDRDATLVVACRIGGRSGVAAQALRQAGFDAWSLRGGVLDWDGRGRPLEPAGGNVADH
jgi:rhodanese-related sulfurtransferase